MSTSFIFMVIFVLTVFVRSMVKTGQMMSMKLSSLLLNKYHNHVIGKLRMISKLNGWLVGFTVFFSFSLVRFYVISTIVGYLMSNTYSEYIVVYLNTYTTINISRDIIKHNFNERTNTLLYKNISLTHYSRKGEVVVIERWAGDRNRLLYWPQVLLTITALLPHLGWGCSTYEQPQSHALNLQADSHAGIISPTDSSRLCPDYIII